MNIICVHEYPHDDQAQNFFVDLDDPNIDKDYKLAILEALKEPNGHLEVNNFYDISLSYGDTNTKDIRKFPILLNGEVTLYPT